MADKSRRILLVNHEYPPLAGSGGEATFHIAEEMARLGHQPLVLTAAWQKAAGLSHEDGVTVRRVRALRQRAGACSVWEMIAFGIAGLITAPSLVRQWRPDSAIVFYGLPNGPIGWWLKHRFHLPYAIALEGGDVPGFGANTFAAWHHLAGGLLRRVWSDADAVVATSDALVELAHRHAPQQAIAVIPSGADVTGIAGKIDYARKGPLQLLFVGRLVHQKGLDVLIQALAALPLTVPWRLVLAGDGPEWTNLAGLAARLNVADRVQVRGWVNRTEVRALFAAADVFVLPCRAAGTPTALLEAMAAGLPVVGTRVAGTSEAVVDGTTGLLVPPEDVDSLAAAIATLANDAQQRAAMGHAARARAEERFGWASIASAWLETTAQIAKPQA